MANLLILISGSNFVTECASKGIFASAPQRAKCSKAAANLYIESPYHTYASVICCQRAHRATVNGK